MDKADAAYEKFDEMRQKLFKDGQHSFLVAAEQSVHDVWHFAQDVHVLVILPRTTRSHALLT